MLVKTLSWQHEGLLAILHSNALLTASHITRSWTFCELDLIQEADTSNHIIQNKNFNENVCSWRKDSKRLEPVSGLSNSPKSREQLPKSQCVLDAQGSMWLWASSPPSALPHKIWLVFWKVTINLPNLIQTFWARLSLSSIMNVKSSPPR